MLRLPRWLASLKFWFERMVHPNPSNPLSLHLRIIHNTVIQNIINFQKCAIMSNFHKSGHVGIIIKIITENPKDLQSLDYNEISLHGVLFVKHILPALLMVIQLSQIF